MTVVLTHAAAVRPGVDAPGVVVTNAAYAALHDDLRERITRSGATAPEAMDPGFPEDRAGIRTRGVLDASWSVRDLAVEAGRRALAGAGIDRERILTVITSTTATADPIPAQSATVQGELGLSSRCAALDVYVGCAGFVAALELAVARLATQSVGTAALVIGAEAMLRSVDAADRSTGMLFGDGAGAVILERVADAPPPLTSWTTLGRQWRDIRIVAAPHRDGDVHRLTTEGRTAGIHADPGHRGKLELSGRTVFRDVVRLVPEAIATHLARAGLRSADVAVFALHQANARMLTAIRDDPRLALPADRMPITIDAHGNTSSASIPIILADAVGRLDRGARVLMAGFGAGLSIVVSSITFQHRNP